MTAQLTDHYGTIDPAAFDGDHPARPALASDLANDRAEARLWGRAVTVPGQGERRVLAVGENTVGRRGVRSWQGNGSRPVSSLA